MQNNIFKRNNTNTKLNPLKPLQLGKEKSHAQLSIDVKNVFYIFYSGHVFYVFYFANVFYF